MEQSYLTEQEAIDECKDLWQRVLDNKESKWRFLQSELSTDKDLHWSQNCPLCHWVRQGVILGTEPDQYNIKTKDIVPCLHCVECERICPLIRQYKKGCMELGYSEHKTFRKNSKWINAVMNLSIDKYKKES